MSRLHKLVNSKYPVKQYRHTKTNFTNIYTTKYKLQSLGQLIWLYL